MSIPEAKLKSIEVDTGWMSTEYDIEQPMWRGASRRRRRYRKRERDQNARRERARATAVLRKTIEECRGAK